MTTEQKPPTHKSPGWQCVHCRQLFPHTKSASEHFDECPALKQKAEASE